MFRSRCPRLVALTTGAIHWISSFLKAEKSSSSPLLNESSGARDLEWLISGELAGVGKGILSDR